jgi:nucleoside-diphosphate-sugar epimerase
MDSVNDKTTGESVLLDDLRLIAESPLQFDQFRGATFLITGATGLIGSLLVKTLLYCNRKKHLDLKILAVIRNRAKADSIFATFLPDASLKYVICDLSSQELKINFNVDYVIHTASVTASHEMISNPVGTIYTALHGTEKILNLSVKAKVRAMVYLSSMEVYGSPCLNSKVTEKDLGYLDLTLPRSCYPESKRMCECLCSAYASQYGLNVKSARLAQTFGAGILPTENRVFAQFARSAMEGSNIVLHTAGRSEGNYVYTRDAVKAILMLLYSGKTGEAYNVANEMSHTTIAEMAKMVANEIAGGRIKVIVDLPTNGTTYGYAPDVKLYLSADKMKRLGWEPEVCLKEAYVRMIRYLTY